MALGVQQFQGVPLNGVVRCGEDDAPLGAFSNHGHLHGGRRGKPEVEDIDAEPHQGAGDQPLHHVAGRPRIPSHDHGGPGALFGRAEIAQNPEPIALCGTHDVGRGEVVAFGPANGASESRDAADERHGAKLRLSRGQRIRNEGGCSRFIRG